MGGQMAIVGHVTYTSKQQRLTTKKRPFQPTFVITYTQLCSFSNDNLWAMQCFESTIFGRLK
jgi:hypothetical protein